MELLASLPLQYSIGLIEDEVNRQKFKCTLSGDNPHIVDEPLQLVCGHIVCKHCLEKTLIKQEQFPCSGTSRQACGVMIKCTQLSFADQFLKRELRDTVVSCKHGGCQWRGTYANFREKHIASCELGRGHFLLAAAEDMKSVIDGLTEENKKLAIEAAGNQQTISQLRKDLALRDSRIIALTEENNQIKAKAQKDPRVTELENKLRDSNGQIESLELIINMLSSGAQASQAPHFEGQVPESPNRSKAPQNQPSAKAVDKVREKASSAVHTKTITINEDDIFSTEATGTLKEFELGGIKALFYLGKSGYGPISLFCQLLESTSWPCTKSVIFTIKDINERTKDNLCGEIHFPRGPARCKEKPGNEDSIAVGFEKFCSLDKLTRSLRSDEPNYFDRRGNCEVEITVRDTLPAELMGPGLDLPRFSEGLLHWPVREINFHVRGRDSRKKVFSSPPFMTAKDGCPLFLELDADKYSFPAYITAQVKLFGKNPKFHNWPVKGDVHIKLVDYNADTHKHIKLTIPIRFDNPAKGIVCGLGNGESEVKQFFNKRYLTPPDKAGEPIYHLDGPHDEILVEATFVPK